MDIYRNAAEKIENELKMKVDDDFYLLWIIQVLKKKRNDIEKFMNEDAITKLASNKTYIQETFSDCPVMMDIFDKAQTYYALTNMYNKFLEDVEEFVNIIKEKNFNIDGFKTIINTFVTSNNEESYKRLAGIIINYLSAKDMYDQKLNNNE